MALHSLNPATGEPVASYEETSPEACAALLDASGHASRAWGARPVAERIPAVRRAGEVLRARCEELARLMAIEMGKPLAQGRAEVAKCAATCDHLAEHGEAYLAPLAVATEARASYVAFRPLGVVLAVMPWNFPLWQVLRFAAPALVAGNAAVLKHASNVTGCALAIEDVFREAGLAQDLFRAVVVPGARVGELVRHPAVAAVTVTGSVGAGRAVAEAAGRALKKTVLELGGSDPYVVLEDADLDLAAETCAQSRLINSGQSCIAAKRFVVVDAVRAAFEERFVARMAARRMGDPLVEGTDVGPQARDDLRGELHGQVARSIERGARVLLGCEPADGPGAYYPPSVLTDVAPGMPAFDEELFGPVAAIVPARDEADALRLANRSCFGLGAAVFTRDRARGERIAREELEAGSCFVNALVRSDPRLPFGGIKESGYGRELAAFGIREFVNVKTVWVE